MKTVTDLNNLIPVIVDQIAGQNHDIADAEIEQPKTNCFTYDEGGWYIEVIYNCSGDYHCESGNYWDEPSCDLISASGEVEEISASYLDEETDEEIEFSGEDLDELWSAINRALENIA